MRLSAYLILAYVAVAVQIGAADFMRIGHAKPDLVLLAVIFISIHAPREPALLGCFGLGLIQDLVSLSPLGLYALAYSLVGMFVVSTQELVYKAHPLTHISLGFVGGLLLMAVVVIHGWMRGPHVSITDQFGGVLYTAALAPFVLGLLNLSRKAFAFSRYHRARTF